MSAAKRAERPQSWDWLQLTNLGEQLRSDESLSAQRDRIISMTNLLIPGKADVWLRESIFHLPDWDEKWIFPPQPVSEGMQRAIKTGKLYKKNGRAKPVSQRTKTLQQARSSAALPLACAAVPLEDQGVNLGALQVTRPKGPAFSEDELNLLLGLAQIVSSNLVASHRVAVEQFRLRQLNLVREVSTQIANVLDVDELAARVTRLIQKTFNYYYVAIFTLNGDSNMLHFRSSAVVQRKGRRKASIPLEVEIGQGLIGECVQKGEPLVSDDVGSDPRFRFIERLSGTQSEVAIPLKIEDRVLGVLDVQSNKKSAFHPNDLLILHALADNIARAVDSARLYGEMRRRADQLALVSEVSRSVTSTLELSQLMRDAASLIHDKFGYPYVSLFTVHPNRRLIVHQAGSGKRSKKMEGFTISLDDAQGIMPWVARNGLTVLANNVSKDERYVPSPLPPGNTKSELCVPLIFNDDVVGLLDIQSDKLNAFTEDDRVMFEAVADTMAAAIRNADLYRSEQWRRQTSDSLREVAGLISSNVGVDEVLETILAELDRNLPIDISAVWLLDGNELCLSAAHGVDADKLESVCIANPDATFAMADALLSDAPIIRRSDDPIWPTGLTAGYDENYSSIAAPLRVGDRPLGVLTLAHHTSGRYGHEAQAIVTTFASYAAVAIENARLYDAAQEQAYASAALLQVAQAVVSLSDLDEILGSITRIMPILVGIKRVALYRWDAERETYLASHHYGFSNEEEEAMLANEIYAGEFPLLDHVCESNMLMTYPLKPRTTPKAWLKIKPEVENEAEMMDADRLLVAVPLSIKSDFFGVMLIEEMEGGGRFRSRRIEIINGIAQQAALAVQNDLFQKEMVVRERLETEVQLARQIQQTFIPDALPAYPNWQIAARWRTARQVGGDFYDVIELPNDKLGIFIADVADKGMPAALFMALTRTLVRAAVLEMGSPAEAVHRVNDLLLPDTSNQGMFVTAVYGELDMKQGTFTYVNAGHNPPFVMRADGGVEKLTRTAVALGVTETPNITQKTLTFSKGDTLFLYTDGLTEAFTSNGEQFGDEHLMDVLKSMQTRTVEDILFGVEEQLNGFIGDEPLGDDLTMMVLQMV
jgi:phosphoserine phosphatase RsbU/P